MPNLMQDVEYYQNQADRNPDCSQYHFYLGQTYARQKRHQEAIASFDKALALDPGYARALTNRGLSYAELGSWDRAINNHTKAIELGCVPSGIHDMMTVNRHADNAHLNLAAALSGRLAEQEKDAGKICQLLNIKEAIKDGIESAAAV